MIFHILWFLLYFRLCNGAGLMGPAEISVQYIKNCTDEHPMAQIHVKMTSKGRAGMAVSGNITMPVDVTDDLSGLVSISINNNGGWKSNYYNAKIDNLCSFCKNFDPELFKDVTKRRNLTNASCPLPKGPYSVVDYSLKRLNKDTMTDVFLYTKFKINVKVVLKKRLILCFDLMGESVPKKTKGKDAKHG